ncbi:MAG: proline dehydrogenase family protein, partial [Anaerolineae bacterium]|nr:proline dehydrogenase family protein [Anaerolineae bacterium]
PTVLGRQIAARRATGAHVNVNQLGEAILGEDEAEARLERYLGLAARPDVACISVKVSSIASQIDLLGEARTLDVLADRLRRLYRAAMAAPYQLPGGGARPKLVTLDMEEYRDLHLTVALFERVLGEPEFASFTGAIVLQAYLPDSHLVQRELDAWAAARVAGGGAPIRVRLVKGANLAMERVDAAVHGWPQAPYLDKAGTDANYK